MKGVKATSWISVLVPGDGDPRHGKNGYSNLGCRCEICRAANAESQAAARVRRAAQPLPDGAEHGSDNAYTNYACRCRPCTTAHTDSHRAWRSRTQTTT